MIALNPLGDRAFLARFGTETEAGRWASAVRTQAWTGVIDVVLAYQTAAVFADPERIALEELELKLRALEPGEDYRSTGTRIHIPVLYDGEDLPDVARRLHLTEPEVVVLHSGHDYVVFAIGFLPGFPYAGYLMKELSGLPRRESPRVRVPVGSVAIVGRQTGVYPNASPGGWHLIGRTPLRIVDLEHEHFPIRAGDRIRFDPIDFADYESRSGELLSTTP